MLKITVEDGYEYRRVVATDGNGFNLVYLVEFGKPVVGQVEDEIFAAYQAHLKVEREKAVTKRQGAGLTGVVGERGTPGCRGPRHTGESPEARKAYFENRDFE